MKLRFFRDKNNHYYYHTYIKGQKCNINIDITDLERKLIHNNMFNNGNDFDYYY